ncbi:MAG: DNA topoisomerase (ATP-hydrolyzing) subunit B [Candidatus Niyogibacteria bacterium]|nr:DNA topoisomerase (ATP-hydrolyzing) subunit B [Candidatus Niyogibacteria bacterium]
MADKNKEESNKSKGYTAKDIYVLEGLEPVRKRPGMYIGSTGVDGLHHLVWEVVDNSIDEAMAGFAKNISVILLPDGAVKVVDDGRGIPVDIHKQTKTSALETVMTTLHAGGKFGGDAYKVAGGLHGVGVSVVNALSSHLRVEVCRDGERWFQEYEKGKPKAKVKKMGACHGSGTSVTFKADGEIFKTLEFDWARILEHIRQQAYLTPSVRISLFDEREKDSLLHQSYGFHFDGGISSYVKYLNGRFAVKHENIFYVNKSVDGIQVEVALQYIDDLQAREMGFANNIYTPEGGMHLTGFRTALTRTLNNYAKNNKFVKAGEDNFTGDDVREGLTAVISIKLREPQFEGQTKAKLGNPEARGAVEGAVDGALSSFLEENPKDGRALIEKVMLALKARKAAKAAKDTVLRRGVLEGLALPGKLADCQTSKAEESEIFIVEGDSAGGSAKMARDRRTQAILPLRGKILNVEKTRLDKMLASKEVKALIIALGAGIADDLNIEKLRYHKVVIMTDADVDGAHIQTLLLTLFYRYYLSLINAGYLYIAQPPLYRIQKGKEARYVYSDEEKARALKEFGKTEDEKGVNIQRYKGLGEMNAEELWETTMDPARRVLKQITINDAEEANRTFDILMGEEVAPRKLFIQTHAKDVQNLDV